MYPKFNGSLRMRQWYALQDQQKKAQGNDNRDPTPEDPEIVSPDLAGADAANDTNE